VGTAALVSLPRAKPRGPGRAKLGSLSTPEAPVLFDGKKHATQIHSREALKPGRTYSGPAIITEYSATTVVPPRNRFFIDRAGNLQIASRT